MGEHVLELQSFLVVETTIHASALNTLSRRVKYVTAINSWWVKLQTVTSLAESSSLWQQLNVPQFWRENMFHKKQKIFKLLWNQLPLFPVVLFPDRKEDKRKQILSVAIIFENGRISFSQRSLYSFSRVFHILVDKTSFWSLFFECSILTPLCFESFLHLW